MSSQSEIEVLNRKTPVWQKQAFAEFVGTFCLVFAGTGSIIVNDVSGMGVTHVGISLTFGLVVMAMIYSIGDISGAHINPAVTLAFALAGRFRFRFVFPFVLAQLTGAIVASAVLKFLFPEHVSLGSTFPSGPILQSFVLEIVLTWMLMLVILSVSTGAREEGITAAIAVGGTVALAAMFAGPICGASMNPARSLGPAIVSMNLGTLWIYMIAPVIGASFAVPFCWCLRDSDCCCVPFLDSSAKERTS
ncbi:MAG: aquaporin [Planctomycetota bacterium]